MKTAYLGEKNPNFRPGETLERWFHQKAVKLASGAKKRGIEVSVTGPELEAQYKLQNGLCWYTGIPLQLARTSDFLTKRQADLSTLSVDRVDSSRGYVAGNIVLCCNAVNKLKGTATERSTRDFINLIVSNAKERCEIKVKRLSSRATLPFKVGLGDVGYDLAADTV